MHFLHPSKDVSNLVFLILRGFNLEV